MAADPTDVLPPRRRWRKRHGLAAWLLLLAASHLVQLRPERAPAPEGFQVYPLHASDGRSVFMAARDLPGPAGAPATPVLLLHGSPMRSFDLRGLAGQLAAGHRVLLPDLPGFGRSQRRLPDYSFAAQADYVQQWLRQLGVARVHVVAYGQAGATALTLSRQAPAQVASLTLVSAIGVQELELLGDHGLNHGLYGTQLLALRLVDWLVPHFGLLDRLPLNVSCARSFCDSDQRPVRGFLSAYAGPLLILHGRADLRVPPAAAREHARVAPQGELTWFEGGHQIALAEPERLISPLRDFLARVDAGTAVTRAGAAPDRLAASAAAFDRHQVEPARGLARVVLMTLIVVGTFLSEDLTCIGAGLLAAHGVIRFQSAALAAFIGIFVGDLFLFFAGRYLGRAALGRAPFRWFVREDAIAASAEWFDQRGPWVILLSRLVPGSRTPTYFTAGLLHRGAWKYIAIFAAAGVVWAPILVWAAQSLGGRVLSWLDHYRSLTIAAAALVALLLWVAVEWVVPAFTFRGRRLLVAKWRRRTRWPLWPMWIVHLPLIPYLIGLGIRHRGFALFTACNPAWPAGGLLGGPRVDGPSDAAAERAPAPSGNSASVFNVWYHRFPDAPRGGVLAIAERGCLEAVGDGQSNLEQLILLHHDAVSLAPHLLSRHHAQLHTVPAAGERVALGDPAAPEFRALAQDRECAITPALTDALDGWVRGLPDFHFGCLEVRAGSVDELALGRGITLTGVAGVALDAGGMGLSARSLCAAWGRLARYWRTAVEIGAAQRARGVPVMPLRHLLAALKGRARTPVKECARAGRGCESNPPARSR